MHKLSVVITLVVLLSCASLGWGITHSLNKLFGRLTGALQQDQQNPPNIFLSASTASDYLNVIYPPRTNSRITYLPSGTSTDSSSPIPHVGAYEDMQREVASAVSGDYVIMSGWEFNFSYPLPDRSTHQTWGQLLTAKAQAGVKIRLMLSDWDSDYGDLYTVLHTVTIPAMRNAVNSLPATSRDNFQFFTALHPATCFGQNMASHHQKTIVVRHVQAQRIVAFVGGLDIANDRDPTIWLDAVFKAEGEVAHDVDRQMSLRWRYYLDQRQNSDPRTAAPLWSAFDTTLAAATFPVASVGNHKAQLIRTVTRPTMAICGYTGLTNIFDVYMNMIRNAESYIYIEDQYARDVRLAAAIVARAAEKPALVVVIYVQRLPNPESYIYSMTERADAKGNFLQHNFFTAILGITPASRRGIYYSGTHYIHSKVMVVDDKWITVGSANTNQRSMRLDTEANLVVENNEFAKQARVRAWAFHLGKTEAVVGTWAASDFVNQWDTVARANAPSVTAAVTARGSGAGSGAVLPPHAIRSSVKGSGVLVNDNSIVGQDSSLISDDLVYLIDPRPQHDNNAPRHDPTQPNHEETPPSRIA